MLGLIVGSCWSQSTVLQGAWSRHCPLQASASTPSPVKFVNPLEVDGFAEPGGWGTLDEELPLLYFFPGMDGALSTPFMQYCELGTNFELACMRHTDGLSSRASFDELTTACADVVAASTSSGRQVLLVGESFGATLAIAVAHRLQTVQELPTSAVRGLVLVNPATSYERSALKTFGPVCASLKGPALFPLYVLSLVAFASLVLTPAYQAPAFISMLASTKLPSLLNNPYREAFLGRVALAAFLGIDGKGLDIGPLLAIEVFAPEDLDFRLREWLKEGARLVNDDNLVEQLRLPALAVVGDTDRLLPSQDEAARLQSAFGAERWRGTVVVPGAGHASTLGNRLDLLAAIRDAFADDFSPSLQATDLVGRAEQPGEGGGGWARGLIDRTFAPLAPGEYTRWNRGGDKHPAGASVER